MKRILNFLRAIDLTFVIVWFLAFVAMLHIFLIFGMLIADIFIPNLLPNW